MAIRLKKREGARFQELKQPSSSVEPVVAAGHVRFVRIESVGNQCDVLIRL